MARVHNWTQGELAANVNYSESLIAAVETCRNAATMHLGRALDRVFATPGYTAAAADHAETPGTFMRLASRIRNRIRKLSFPVSFRPFAGAEEDATALYIFEQGLFPGLFQTKGVRSRGARHVPWCDSSTGQRPA